MFFLEIFCVIVTITLIGAVSDRKRIFPLTEGQNEDVWFPKINGIDTTEFLIELSYCKDLPVDSQRQEEQQNWCDEQREIARTRPGGLSVSFWGENEFLCANLFILKVQRGICEEFEKNIPAYRAAFSDIMEELGLGTFATTPMNEIFAALEKKTGLRIGGRRNDLIEIMFEVIEEDYIDKV